MHIKITNRNNTSTISEDRSALHSSPQPVSHGKADPQELRYYQTPLYFLREFRKVKRLINDNLAIDFRLDWLIKQWDSLHNMGDYLKPGTRYQFLNYHRVTSASKAVRVPRTEPFLLQLFSERFDVKLPETNPVKAEDVYKADDECFGRYTSFKKFKIKEPKSFYLALSKTLEQSGFIQKVSFKLGTIESAFENLPKNTSSCYPTMTKKNTDQAKEYASKFVKKVFSLRSEPRAIMNLMYHHFCVVFHRIQVSIQSLKKFEADTKIRQVFGVAFGIVLLEHMLFGRFVHKALLDPRNVLAVGNTRPQTSEVIKRMRRCGAKYVICGDYRKFDSTIPPQLLEIFYSSLIQCSRVPERYKNIASCLGFYLTYTPFLSKGNKVEYMLGGNTSGSYLTTLVNSFISILVIQYASVRYFGATLPKNSLCIQGDDFIIAVNDKEFCEFLATVCEEFNITLNLSKTVISNLSKGDDISFLGFNWDVAGEPDQSFEWIVSHTVYPERSIDSISGNERVIARLASVIFQIKSGPAFWDRFISMSRVSFREEIRQAKGRLNLRLINDDGSLSNYVVPFGELYRKNWRMF